MPKDTRDRRAYNQALYLLNREKILLKKRARYVANRDKMCQKQRERYHSADAATKDRRVANLKRWTQANPTKTKAWKKAYREKNREVLRVKNKEYRQRNLETCRAKSRGRKKPAGYYRNRRKTDPQYKVTYNLRRRLAHAMTRKLSCKSASFMTLIGCSMPELMNHLKSLFQPGMTWENYGKDGWHIDHIIPCAAFDMLDPEQQKVCFHWTNLQPLWAADNLKKGASLIVA